MIKSTNQPVNKLINQSDNAKINPSINQYNNINPFKFIHKPFIQPINLMNLKINLSNISFFNESIIQSINQSIDPSINHWFVQLINFAVNLAINHWFIQLINQSIKESYQQLFRSRHQSESWFHDSIFLFLFLWISQVYFLVKEFTKYSTSGHIFWVIKSHATSPRQINAMKMMKKNTWYSDIKLLYYWRYYFHCK